MILRTPRSTRTDTLVPYATLFRSPINNNGLSRTLQLIHALRDAVEPTHRIALAYRQVEKNQSEGITEFPGVLERPQVHVHRGAHGHPLYVRAAPDHVLAQRASRRGHQYASYRTVAAGAVGHHVFRSTDTTAAGIRGGVQGSTWILS